MLLLISKEPKKLQAKDHITSHIAQLGHPTYGNLRRRCQENSRVSTNRFDSRGVGGGGGGADSKLERRLEQTCESNSMIIELAARIKPI